MKKQIKLFTPTTAAEKQLVRLVQGMIERIQSDGFSEWHSWKNNPACDHTKCPNSSPFIPFLRAWIKEDKKTRLPIYLAAWQEHARDVFMLPDLTITAKVKGKKQNVH